MSPNPIRRACRHDNKYSDAGYKLREAGSGSGNGGEGRKGKGGCPSRLGKLGPGTQVARGICHTVTCNMLCSVNGFFHGSLF